MRLTFTSSSNDIDHILLKARYQRLWKEHGDAILDAFQKVTDVPFLHGAVVRLEIVEDYEEHWSNSGITGKEAIELFHTGDGALEAELLWNLCHELGHRLLGQHGLVINEQELGIDWPEANYEAHKILFVFLLDTIRQAFDDQTVDAVLQFARRSYFVGDEPDALPYQKSWLWAEALGTARRHKLTRSLFVDRVVLLPE